MKMREIVKSKMAKYLDPLLEVPSAEKYHWWFASMLDSNYINESTDVVKLHEKETADTRTVSNEMMPKFYDYILAAELVDNPYIAPTALNTESSSFYFNEETVGAPITESRGGDILRERIES